MTDFPRGCVRLAECLIAALIALLLMVGCSTERVRISATARHASEENRRGLLAASRGDWDGAQEEFRSALKLNGSIENSEGMALNLLNMSRLHRSRGEMKQAEEEIDRALALLANSSPLYAEAAFEKARVSQQTGDLPTAATWAKKSLEASDDRERGSRLNLLGRLLYQQGMKLEAEQLARQALSINQQNGVKEEEANSARLLGDILSASGDTPAAMKSYESALVIDKELGRSGKITQDLTALGNAAEGAALHEKALGYYIRAVSVCQYGDDKAHASELMLRISRLYEKLGNNAEAATWNTRRERLFKGLVED